MTEWRLIKLDFGRSPAHFGELGIGIEETSERVRSDTLFSAWITVYARLFDSASVTSLLEQFISESTPPFRLSSTFVYREVNGQTIYYLPRPVKLPNHYPHGNDLEFAKTFKGLKFLPLKIWQRWYQGEGFTESDRQQLIAKTKKDESGFKDEELDKAGTFDYSKAFETHKMPKVAIDRTTRATNFYHTGFVQFRWEEQKKSGLYFLLKMPQLNPDLESDLKAALEFLGEEGLGGERSSGAGRFTVKHLDKLPNEWQAVVNAEGKQYSLISTFWDSSLETNLLDQASYELQERGGWITSPFSGRQQRRKTIRMFLEGSVFSSVPVGKLVDVTPDGFKAHRIYRSGVALSLPINTNSN